jgi:hypothetical protein
MSTTSISIDAAAAVNAHATIDMGIVIVAVVVAATAATSAQNGLLQHRVVSRGPLSVGLKLRLVPPSRPLQS